MTEVDACFQQFLHCDRHASYKLIRNQFRSCPVKHRILDI
jgi:hypothetical protein